jgi:PAS domain S-box-containing protein
METDTYRLLFERSADAILIIAGDRYVDCNASAVKLFRYENKLDVLNRHPAELSPQHQPDGSLSHEKAEAMIAIALERGSHRFEWDHKRADGSIVPVEVSLTSVTDDCQNILHVILRDITEEKRAKEEKLQTENKLKAIFNHRFQLTGLLAADGTLLMANQTACAMVGVDSDEIEGKYFWELPHWAHSKELQRKAKDATLSAQQGNSVSFETTHLDFNDEIRFVDFSLTPVRNEEGEVIFIVPEGQDVTTRKLSEQNLIESERNYREIYNSSSDAIIIHDAESGNIIDVNHTMLEMYGYSHEEALQRDIGDLSSNEPGFTQQDAVEKVQRAIEGGPQLFEWFARHKNGISFWVEVALRKTTIGGEGRVLAVVRDISERKRVDNELLLVKSSIEHSAFPFEWIREDAQFAYVNEATCRSLGYTREELCSMKVVDIDPDFTLEGWPGFWEQMKTQRSLAFETSHVRKDGRKFPVEITANYVEFEGQGHVFAHVQDISDRIRFERKQKQLQRQLQQAQKMEAIGTLAGGIAHDFNNILGAIYGYTEIAQDHVNDPEELREALKQIYGGAQRARDLVQQILTFGRKGDHELRPLKVQLVLTEALKLLRSTIPSTIKIEQDIDPDCGDILADSTQIHQIVMNLCTNAYQSMRETGGELVISLQPFELAPGEESPELDLSSGPYLRMGIRDSGSGIHASDLDRIFEPYFTTRANGEGTGLGLAMVHGIVKSFGGDITVDSEPGKGTTFHVYFPVIEQKKQALPEELTTPLPSGSERILIVDDDEAMAQVSKKLLESHGYRATAMTESVAALGKFQGSPDDFDLVITDITMPGMTGIDLAHHILQIRPEMPIIMCTGFSELISVEKAKAIGISEYLVKPVTRTDLLQAVRKVLDVPDGI